MRHRKGGARADFECWNCIQVKQLKKDIDDLKAMLGALKGNEEAKSVNNNRTAHYGDNNNRK